ncbi:hypothetical protein [uncultured Mucilaginibacter sp.]|uniref:hypothetical protein n=1 Tax=uncultured Mucilaginibacter sp. TaxID=797541 RepID=UPI0025D9AB11|nr:hypothetical protein [uncultured Mucilaginibacter sp.]
MKKELEKKRLKKKEDKAYRKEERLKNATGGDLDSMLAYVNENGEIVSTPQTKSIVEEDEPATH